jgi:hypothetical protein
MLVCLVALTYIRSNYGVIHLTRWARYQNPEFPGRERTPSHLNYTQTQASLKNMLTLMRRSNLPFWLMYGSLLGLVRDRGVICYDHDNDLAALSVHFDSFLRYAQAVCKRHARYRYVAIRVPYFPKIIVLFDTVTGLNTDIYFFNIKTDSAQHSPSHAYPLSWITPLRTLRDADNNTFHVPNQYAKLLQHEYGDGWRIAVQNCTSSCQCSVPPTA